MSENELPTGWNDAKIKTVLDHYEGQSDDEEVAEDEAAFADRTETVMNVPIALVPAVRELIGKHLASGGA